MIVAVTGHRPEKFTRWTKKLARYALHDALDKIALEHPRMTLLSGGARGVDLWAADWALDCHGHAVPFQFVLPALGHADRWSREEWVDFDRLHRRARPETVIVCEKLDGAAYLARNRYLVDHCNLLVAVYDGVSKGGTAYTVEYARRVGRETRMVAA